MDRTGGNTRKLTQLFRHLHRDESGDIPVGPILVIGLIVIPLVIALVAFGDAIVDWLKQQWDSIKGNPGVQKKPF